MGSDYLAALEPWAALPADTVDEIAKAMTERRAAEGETLIEPDCMPPAVFVVRDGHVRIETPRGSRLADLGAGSTLGARRLLRSETDPTRVSMTTDGTLLVLPVERFLEIADANPAFRSFFARHRHPEPKKRILAATPVSELMTRDPLTAPPDLPVVEAAKRMRARAVASIVVTSGDVVTGILTVRDIANRIVAEGRDPAAPLEPAMTADPVTLPPGATGSDVLHLMMERSISHVPIVSDEGLVGIVSKTDLSRFQAESSHELIGDAADAPDVAALARATARIPTLLLQLTGAGNRHDIVTRYISDIADAVTRRLLVLAEEELGPPPVPYLWAACGSQGRREQSGKSDQDNVLILSDKAGEAKDGYFADLATFVCDGLNDVGYVYCPGEMMATNPRWRQPLSVWSNYFNSWIENPSGEAQMLASVMFDLRPIGGDTTLFDGVRRKTLERSSRNSIFVAHMASNALKHEPPLSFWRGLATVRSGEHRNTIDMKLSGVIPIVDLARIYALRGALMPVNTRERLEAAIREKVVTERDGRDLLDAYDLIADLRLQHQATQIRDGDPPDNFMPPARLSAFERSHLREAFVVVRARQSGLAHNTGIR